MSFPGRVEPLTGALPRVSFQWDAETEILAARLCEVSGERGFTGSIELEDRQGAVLTLDVVQGVTSGVEIVVWPQVATEADLRPPPVKRQGRLVVPARPSQPGVGVVEIEVPLSAVRSADESVIHVRVGPGRSAEPVRLGDNVIAEIDAAGDLAGFWLLDVPPFPGAERVR